MIREPAVADRFYPGKSDVLSRTVTDLFPEQAAKQPKKAIAAVSPHAGYVYSGGVAAETFSSIKIPETVIIIGLNHHGNGAPVALSTSTWKMPMGEVPVNQEFSRLLMSDPGPFIRDEVAHQYEHSVEVQIPFLQAIQPHLSIVPIVLSHLSYSICMDIANALTRAIQNFPDDVLIVASSDMTHYESRESASRKDKLALSQIENLDPEALYKTVHQHRISMCGVVPVTVALLTANQLGAQKAEIVRYTDSGEASGDTDQVVGYAGVVIS